MHTCNSWFTVTRAHDPDTVALSFSNTSLDAEHTDTPRTRTHTLKVICSPSGGKIERGGAWRSGVLSLTALKRVDTAPARTVVVTSVGLRFWCRFSVGGARRSPGSGEVRRD